MTESPLLLPPRPPPRSVRRAHAQDRSGRARSPVASSIDAPTRPMAAARRIVLGRILGCVAKPSRGRRTPEDPSLSTIAVQAPPRELPVRLRGRARRHVRRMRWPALETDRGQHLRRAGIPPLAITNASGASCSARKRWPLSCRSTWRFLPAGVRSHGPDHLFPYAWAIHMPVSKTTQLPVQAIDDSVHKKTPITDDTLLVGSPSGLTATKLLLHVTQLVSLKKISSLTKNVGEPNVPRATETGVTHELLLYVRRLCPLEQMLASKPPAENGPDDLRLSISA